LQKINKSAEILAQIGKKRVIGATELTQTRHLLNLFTSSGKGKGLARRRIIDTTALLARQGFISVGELDGEKIYKLNRKGKSHLESYLISKRGIPRPARWDGKWYLVTFDIPESKKTARNNLINQLKDQGFISYTKGLWIYPYNPADYISGISRQLDIESAVHLITAIKLDNEKKLKKHFALA